jgi:hypothetical protein
VAIDYFLTLHKFGSNANEMRVRKFLLNEFQFVDNVDTRILTRPGLSVNVFIDDDTNDLADASNRPDLVISFRISKDKEDTRLGYLGMRSIVDLMVSSFDVDLRIGDEFDQYIYLTKVAGNVEVRHQDHDFWKVGVDLI